MNHIIESELISIAKDIKNLGKSDMEWVEMESDDMFRTEKYTGGFDATEMAFLFEYRPLNGHEQWIQFKPKDIDSIISGHITELVVTNRL